jgi:hypothetical protein
MNPQNRLSIRLLALASAVLFGAGLTTANATEPCEDFGECKVLIEMNSTDGDIGFHFLMDGDDLIRAKIFNPDHRKIFSYVTRRELRKQFLTETFAESAEPLCWESPDAEEDDEIVTLEEFLDRFTPGTYHFLGIGEDYEVSWGHTELMFDLPAAPDLDEDDGFDVDTSIISWSRGDDLGECATYEELVALVDDDVLPEHPEDVLVAAWEVVFEPDVEDGDPKGALVFSVRIPAIDEVDDYSVTVPADYLLSLGDNTLVKIEVGAIGEGDNATFTEIFDICVNEMGDGCPVEDEDEDEDEEEEEEEEE